jgi:hypothetical protein
MHRALAVCSTCLAGVLVAGCGLRDPYVGSRTATSTATEVQSSTVQAAATSTASQSAAAPAMTGTSPAAQSNSPRAALERFATSWVDWTAGGQASQRARMLSQATGPLLSELGNVEAQMPYVTRGTGGGRYVGAIEQSANNFLVVTYELSGTGKQAQAAYGVYLATVADTSAGWKLSAWTPTSS